MLFKSLSTRLSNPGIVRLGKNESGIVESLLERKMLCFHSSSEHKMLRVSYCDRPLSVVRQQFLLLNHWANLNEIWQGCSLGKVLQKMLKDLNSVAQRF